METSPQKLYKVLVVDDCEMNRKLLAAILKRKGGVSFELASDGIEALSKIHNSEFDLVFMDIRMPNMDGFTAVSEIRRLWPQRNIPVLAVTASTGDTSGQTYIDAGFTGSLHKPISINDIDDLLAKMKPQHDQSTVRFLCEGK